MSKSTKLLVLTGLLSSFVFAFPVTTSVVAESSVPAPAPQAPVVAPVQAPTAVTPEAPKAAAAAPAQPKPLDGQLLRMLQGHGVSQDRLPRVVRAIMESSHKYKVDPKLVTSIVIVESGANPFAVSSADAVGIMQIHLPTWGKVADRENINLFKIEDNIDLGVRILHDYISDSDIWEGVARYLGKGDSLESQRAANAYVRKVQRIYGVDPDNTPL